MYLTLLPGRHMHCWGAGPLPLRSRAPVPQQILKLLLTPLAHFYSATLAYLMEWSAAFTLQAAEV